MSLPAYPKYKDSGVEWLGDVPEHWDVLRLKFVGDAIIGITYSPEETVDEGQGHLVLRSSNVQQGKLAFQDNVFVDKTINDRDVTQLHDVLICARNGSAHLVGKCAIIDKFNTGHTFGAFMSIFRSEDGRYLYHFFSSNVFKAQTGLFKTSTINQLTSGVLNNLFVAFPPEFERVAIADYLEKKMGQIDTLIEKKKELIERLKEQRTAIITHAVTKGLDDSVPMKNSGIEWLGDVPEHWEVRRMKLNISKAGSGVTPKGGANVYRTTGVPFLRSQNIHFDGLRLDDVAYIEKEVHDSMSIGRSYFFDGSIEDANVNQHVCIIRPEASLLTRFLHYVLWSDMGQLQIQLEQTGSGREGLNFEALKNFYFPLMSEDEQQSIVDHLVKTTGKMDDLVEKTKESIQRLEEYRTAVITAAVTGKVKVDDG